MCVCVVVCVCVCVCVYVCMSSVDAAVLKIFKVHEMGGGGF